MSLSKPLPSTRNVHPLLAAYLSSLARRPLTTKMLTGGVLSFLQELLASSLASSPPPTLPRSITHHAPPPLVSLLRLLAQLHIGPKALKLALYGLLVSAPMGHYMVLAVTKAFAGKTGAAARVGQVLMSNLVIAPVQVSAYLMSMALINGAHTSTQISRAVRAGFMPAMKVTWMTSPAAMVIAQRFLAPELWAPFFSLVNFCLGTYFSYTIKRAHAAKAKGKGKSDHTPPSAPTASDEAKKEL